MAEDELVTVAAYTTALGAEAAKNFLEANGVQAFLADENATVTMWSGLVEAKVQVAPQDVDLAKKLLTEHHDESDIVDDEDTSE